MVSAARERLGDLGGDGGEHVVLVVEEDRELGGRLGGDAASSACARHSSAMNGLAASRPSATTSSVGRVAPPAISSIVFSVASASTIMIATSPRSSTRPATTMSNVARSSSAWVGNATHWPSMSATRVAPIGPLNGRPEICVDADAALIATHVVEVVGVERHDRDDDLDLVAQALDEGRAQRAVDQPAGEDGVLARAALAAEERAGDAPAAYMRSSTSTVSGKKSKPSRGACRPSWPTAAWCRRRGRRRRNRRPAGPAGRSRSGWCACRSCRCR